MIGDDVIQYRAGYKYVLAEDHTHALSSAWQPYLPDTIRTPFVVVFPSGRMTILAGYAWDGPSGPTLDTPDSMRGSLIHDALYQLLREEALPAECRALADLEFYRVLRDAGMGKIRARAWYEGVQHFAAGAARPDGGRPILTAP